MAGMLDYVRWRGDLPFTVSPPNEVDALIFSTLSYITFRGRAEIHPEEEISLHDAAEEFFSFPEPPDYVRGSGDLDLFKAAGESVRFGTVGVTEYRTKFIEERDTQFAAVTFLLNDGSLFISFRGTDNTLVGWKEDFSMSFRSVIPSQALAKQYLQDVLMTHSGPVRVSGHSKGGNVAVYAVSQSAPVIRDRVLEVYNQEGPGFSAEFLEGPGAGMQRDRGGLCRYIGQNCLLSLGRRSGSGYGHLRRRPGAGYPGGGGENRPPVRRPLDRGQNRGWRNRV